MLVVNGLTLFLSYFNTPTAGWKRKMRKTFFNLGVCTMLFGFSFSAQAQETQKTWKIGVLVSGTAAINAARDEALRRGLSAFGYEDGKNLVIVYKYAEGKTDRLPQLAKELVAENPDVIVVGGTAVAVAAKNATSTIPIVVAGAVSITAGISPALAATWVAGSGRPVIRRAASRTSRTLLERPDPMISGPTQRRFQASSSPRTTSLTWTKSRTWVPSP
jgi:putative ABC transport system substrate-binding protein